MDFEEQQYVDVSHLDKVATDFGDFYVRYAYYPEFSSAWGFIEVFDEDGVRVGSMLDENMPDFLDDCDLENFILRLESWLVDNLG